MARKIIDRELDRAVTELVKQVRKNTPSSKKRFARLAKRLDFHGLVLNQLQLVLDGLTIDPVKGVILTAKKKRQIAELKRLECRLFPKKKPR